MFNNSVMLDLRLLAVGGELDMPYWSQEQESILADMIRQGKTVEEIATTLGKSVEAVTMKVRRIGFVLPREGKVTVSSTTTILEPILPAKDMLSLQEMMQILLWGFEPFA